ncbi:MAG: dTDP-4-dehydrorhamnose 3,5-epimerase [Bacillota bacterium]|nr:dTDP-4-dehydrorhamnose 3,5-epimerase [Bacillota bacterium]
MKFKETNLGGAYLLELEAVEDERGFFARTFCRQEFARQGLNFNVAQANLSRNSKRGTLRGMHYQVEPMAEVRVVQCVRGSLYDVIIDLRPQSETCCRWLGVELSADNRRLLYVPEGFAHGFQTLEDDTAVHYLMSQFYAPEYARGVRWNDPAFGIKWPLSDPVISEKDRQLPDYQG